MDSGLGNVLDKEKIVCKKALQSKRTSFILQGVKSLVFSAPSHTSCNFSSVWRSIEERRHAVCHIAIEESRRVSSTQQQAAAHVCWRDALEKRKKLSARESMFRTQMEGRKGEDTLYWVI